MIVRRDCGSYYIHYIIFCLSFFDICSGTVAWSNRRSWSALMNHVFLCITCTAVCVCIEEERYESPMHRGPTSQLTCDMLVQGLLVRDVSAAEGGTGIIG